MKKFFQRYNLKHIRNEMNKYGFKFSTKELLLQSFGIMGIIFIISYLSQLERQYIAFLMIASFLLTPLLINAWFNQLYNMKRFTMLTDYLSNIIPIFMQKAKIRFALGEVLELTTFTMHDSIKKAIDYIDNNTKDINVHKNALAIIEKEFPNSRLKSAHKLMLTIEEESSRDYHQVCENLYVDIENWIKRVYSFQKDLKNRRNKLVFLCILTLFMNCLFVYLYVSNEYFTGFTDNTIYQLITTGFIFSILVVAITIMTRLHGEWLVNDMTNRDEELIKRSYEKILKGKPERKPIDYIMTGLFIVVGIYFLLFKQNTSISTISILMGVFVYYNKSNKFNVALNRVNKQLTIEFPVWLREISLSLNNLTVLNSIERSRDIASYPLQQEIDKFLEVAQKNPTSIKPYTQFLNGYDLADAQSSMKVLYSVQNIGKSEIQAQVSSLILRNQEMLDKAETIRNNDSITGIEALGYIPVIIFTIEMLVSMFLMFGFMLDKMSSLMVY